MSSRSIVAGDLLALFAFAVLGLASHEHEVTASALARTFIPFAAAWLIVGGVTGSLRPDPNGRPALGLRFLVAYLVAGVLALVARSIVFDRTLLNTFFIIALVGNGLFLFAWRYCARWMTSRAPVNSREVTHP